MTPTGQASRQQVSAPSVGPERGNVGAARTPSEGRRGPRCRLARRQRATSRRPSGGQGFSTDPAGVRSHCLGPGVAPWVAPPTCRSRTTSSPATGVFGCIKAQGGRWKSAESAPSGALLTPPASFPDVPSLRGPQRHPQVSCAHYPEAWSGARGQGPGSAAGEDLPAAPRLIRTTCLLHSNVKLRRRAAAAAPWAVTGSQQNACEDGGVSS